MESPQALWTVPIEGETSKITNHEEAQPTETTTQDEQQTELKQISGQKTTSNQPEAGDSPSSSLSDEALRREIVSQAIDAALNAKTTNTKKDEKLATEKDQPCEVQPFDVLVSLAQTMAVSEHAGNKLLMTFCYQAAPHFSKCENERQKYTMAEQLLKKMQNDLGTRFLWESSHLPTPIELAITATCILIDLMPTQHDVVFTRTGSLVPQHAGNEFFVMLCQAFLIRIEDVHNVVTLDFITSEMEKLAPPGRFLLAHESEFKFTPMEDDQRHCFILRHLLDEDRHNYRRVVSTIPSESSEDPDTKEESEIQTLIVRRRKRKRLFDLTRQHYMKTSNKADNNDPSATAPVPKQQIHFTRSTGVPSEEDANSSSAEKSHEKEKVKAIVMGKAATENKTKAAVKSSAVKSAKSNAAATKARAKIGKRSETAKTNTSKAKVIWPTETVPSSKTGVRVIYPTTSAAASPDNQPGDSSKPVSEGTV